MDPSRRPCICSAPEARANTTKMKCIAVAWFEQWWTDGEQLWGRTTVETRIYCAWLLHYFGKYVLLYTADFVYDVYVASVWGDVTCDNWNCV